MRPGIKIYGRGRDGEVSFPKKERWFILMARLLTLQDKRDKKLMDLYKGFLAEGMRAEKALKRARETLKK